MHIVNMIKSLVFDYHEFKIQNHGMQKCNFHIDNFFQAQSHIMYGCFRKLLVNHSVLIVFSHKIWSKTSSEKKNIKLMIISLGIFLNAY